MKYWLSFAFVLCFLSVYSQDSTAVVQDTVMDYYLENTETSSINYAVIDSVRATIPEAAYIEPAKKKKWNVDKVHILIGFNYSFFNPVVSEKDDFHGAYYPVKDSTPVWTDRTTNANLSKNYKSSNIQFNLQANFWKGLYFGMNYQFLSIRKYKKDPNLGNLLSKNNAMFFIVSAQFGYVFEFLKNKALQIHPSIRIGGYSADDYYDNGIGKKVYVGTDLQVRYLIKRKAGFSLGFDYDFLRYKKKGYNDIFQRDTYQKTTFNNLHINAGVYFNISIDTKK